MIDSYSTNISSVVASFSQVLDFVDKAAMNHHLRVAFIAYRIGEEFGLEETYLSYIALAGCFHDIGIFSTKDKISSLEFDPGLKNLNLHGELAFLLLKEITNLKDVAKIIRYHHVNWTKNPYRNEEEIPIGSYVLHLADRIEVMLRKVHPLSVKRYDVIEHFRKNPNNMFMPELIEAFVSLSNRVGFWFDMEYPKIEELVEDILPNFVLDLEDLMLFSNVIRKIIDYRCSFTAVHSAGVSAVAAEIGKIFNLSDIEIKLIKLAGYLHDIGKLAVPVEILQKPGKLTKEEWSVMMAHAYYSYRILDKLKGLKIINLWGSLHHEKPNGSGYPFGLKDEKLLLGSKIMSVSDVFVAISEDRPYRKGLEPNKIKEILSTMAKDKSLDSLVTEQVLKHFDDLIFIRKEAQSKAKESYLELKEKINL